MPFRAPEKADLRNYLGSHNAKPFSPKSLQVFFMAVYHVGLQYIT